MILFRPTGLKELALIFQSDMSAWPPRLPDQPIFYPVLNQNYARQIARDWNTKFDSCVGYVTRFEIADSFADKYDIKVVGGREHEELWVPSEDLGAFNTQLIRPIEVLEAYFGKLFLEHSKRDGYHAEGQDASHTLWQLGELFDYNMAEFEIKVQRSRELIFLHFPYWLAASTGELAVPDDRRKQILEAIEIAWQRFCKIPLCKESYRVDVGKL